MRVLIHIQFVRNQCIHAASISNNSKVKQAHMYIHESTNVDVGQSHMPIYQLFRNVHSIVEESFAQGQSFTGFYAFMK